MVIVAIYMLCSSTCVSIEARSGDGKSWTREACKTYLELAHTQARAAGLRMFLGSCVEREK